MLSHDLARDQSPAQVSARSRWLHPGFPLAESSDLCEALYVLAKAGLDPSAAAGRLDEALRVLQAKQDAQGRWSLEMALPNTWAAFGQPGQPNKWITVRALAAIQALA